MLQHRLTLAVLFIETDDAFVGLKNVRGLFNTRDRAEHTRKRKIVSATFAQRNVLEFEPYIASVMRQLLNKWDAMCDKAVKDGKGWVTLDTLTWLNFLAFDIIGEWSYLFLTSLLPCN